MRLCQGVQNTMELSNQKLNWFSKFFHCQNQQEMWNKSVVILPTKHTLNMFLHFFFFLESRCLGDHRDLPVDTNLLQLSLSSVTIIAPLMFTTLHQDVANPPPCWSSWFSFAFHHPQHQCVTADRPLFCKCGQTAEAVAFEWCPSLSTFVVLHFSLHAPLPLIDTI